MDQLSAHLDRAWNLVGRGDTHGAEASARQALDLDPNNPEVHNLLGFVAASEGDPHEAVEHYRHAFALDDTYLEAMLNAAELLIHPICEFDDALALCEQALELVEAEDERLEVLLMMVEAVLGKGDIEAVRAILQRLPATKIESPHHMFLAGRAYFEIGDGKTATPLIEQAVAADPENAEAWYYMGLVHEDRGESRQSVECFLKTRRLDSDEPTMPWASHPEVFAGMVKNVISGLDSALLAFLGDIDVFVADLPGVETIADGIDPRAFVLLDTAMEREGQHINARLFVYQRNVERMAGEPDAVEEGLQHVIEHEISMMLLDQEMADRDPSDRHNMN